MQQQFPIDLLKQCIFLAGPTAAGKTETTVSLVSRIPNIEIVSLDSMCIYRGMDIGTAKPSREMQLQIPHHLLDIIEPRPVAIYSGEQRLLLRHGDHRHL